MSATQVSTTVDFHDLRGNVASTERIRDYRRVEVGRMLLARVPIRMMATRLNVSTRTVQKDIRVIERWWAERAITDRAALIKQESTKLDELESWWMERAFIDPTALDNVLRIMAMRAKIHGLNAPTQSEVTIGGSVEELQALAIEMIRDDLMRRRELDARRGAIDVGSSDGR
jgi:hypothetical protein